MTNERLTHLEYVSQLLNLKFKHINQLTDDVCSELDLARSYLRQLMFIYSEWEEEKELNQILKEFNKTLP